MSPNLTMWAAQAELYARAHPTAALRQYLNENHLDIDTVTRTVGAFGLLPIRTCGSNFDFGHDDDPLGFICEVLADDGVTVDDLVAWPLASPANFKILLGRGVILGLEHATNPASYHFGKPLEMFRTPIGLLQAGGKGAVVLDRARAGRFLIDLPGAVAGEDVDHARELLQMAEAVVDRSRFVAPATETLRLAA